MGTRGWDFNLDPPPERESWPCSACDETGFLCLGDSPCRETLPVTQVKIPSDTCNLEHKCPACKGEGRVYETATKEYDG
jgi:hypothetical protein